MDVCDECKVIEICSCEDFCIAPDGGITAGEDYVITITDKFGIKNTQEITATVYGTLCVDITGFPDAFFNPYAGTLIVTITLAGEAVQVVYGSLNYTCISLVVKDCPNSVANPPTPAPADCICVTEEDVERWNDDELGVESVTGNIVDNTDPNNPVVTGLASGDNVSELVNDAGYLTTAVQSVVAGNAITVDNTDPQNPIVNALTPVITDGLLTSGSGRVTWISNYDYEGSPSLYAIGGQIYTTGVLPTPMTLAPADATFDRLDTFILNTSGAWAVLTGTPSANPLEPDVDVTTQLRVAFALVQAGTTSPTLPTEDIYLENTEWVTADNTANINLASTNFPYAGAVDIEGANVANGNFITLTPALFPSLILLDSFIFKIRSKATWNNPSRLVFQFQNGTTNVGNAINFGNGSYGFVSSTTGAYQNINIPLTDFGNIAAATRLRIMKTGAGTIGFYLDNIQMVGNNNVVVNPPPYKVYSALLFQQGQSDGLLTVGVEYTIGSYSGGDDFTNVGATLNVTGEVFVATGTTPATWTNFSFLTNNLAPVATVLENTLGNIVWTRPAIGGYNATLANAFPLLKTWSVLSKNDNTGLILQWVDVNTMSVSTSMPVSPAAPGDPIQNISQDGLLLYTPVEIRVYT